MRACVCACVRVCVCLSKCVCVCLSKCVCVCVCPVYNWLEAESNCTLVMFFQMDYFQDNIYPEVRVKFEAAVTAEEWFSGKDGTQLLVYNQKE